MVSTKDHILQLADELILNKGFNAFSFADISERLGIKKASIHYHFVSKEQLGISLVKYHTEKTSQLFTEKSHLPSIERLLIFFDIYEQRQQLSQVCLVGSLGTDFYTIPATMQTELKALGSVILKGLTEILIDGKKENTFRFADQPRTKALMIITNLLGGLQLSRLTGTEDFEIIKRSILDNLLYKQ